MGEYLCSDLACSLYMRGKRQPKLRLVRFEETVTLDEKIARAMDSSVSPMRAMRVAIDGRSADEVASAGEGDGARVAAQVRIARAGAGIAVRDLWEFVRLCV